MGFGEFSSTPQHSSVSCVRESWLCTQILGSTWKCSAALDGVWNLPLHKTHLQQGQRIFPCSLSGNCPWAKKFRTTNSMKMELKMRMDAVQEKVSGIVRLGRKKASCPKLRVFEWRFNLHSSYLHKIPCYYLQYHWIKTWFCHSNPGFKWGPRCFPQITTSPWKGVKKSALCNLISYKMP